MRRRQRSCAGKSPAVRRGATMDLHTATSFTVQGSSFENLVVVRIKAR